MPGPVLSGLDLIPYRLPLRRPWASARGELGCREGWLVIAEAEGRRGYGDCSPLPEAGTEAAGAADLALAAYARGLVGLGLAPILEALHRDSFPSAPAAACAVECALSDLSSRLAGRTLRDWLAPGARGQVPVNAALGPVLGVAPVDLERAAAAGIRVVKLKVGIGEPGSELRRLRELTRALPGAMGLRLDANGGWDQETATRMVRALADLPVESLEEPLAVPETGALRVLQALASFPLALDESLPFLARDPDPADLPVRRVVLKPGVIGGLRRTLNLARRLGAGGVEVVITSLIESAAGLWPTVQLAAALGSDIPQGLATADWLGRDLGPAPRVEAGQLCLPARPGSGFVPGPGSGLVCARGPRECP